MVGEGWLAMVEAPWVTPENADGMLDRLSLHVCPPRGGGCVFTSMAAVAQGMAARGDLSAAFFLLTQAHGAALGCPVGCEAERDLESLLLTCHAGMRARGQALAGPFASVERAILRAHPGARIRADLDSGRVTVEPGGDAAVICRAVEGAGFGCVVAA